MLRRRPAESAKVVASFAGRRDYPDDMQTLATVLIGLIVAAGVLWLVFWKRKDQDADPPGLPLGSTGGLGTIFGATPPELGPDPVTEELTEDDAHCEAASVDEAPWEGSEG